MRGSSQFWPVLTLLPTLAQHVHTWTYLWSHMMTYSFGRPALWSTSAAAFCIHMLPTSGLFDSVNRSTLMPLSDSQRHLLSCVFALGQQGWVETVTKPESFIPEPSATFLQKPRLLGRLIVRLIVSPVFLSCHLTDRRRPLFF